MEFINFYLARKLTGKLNKVENLGGNVAYKMIKCIIYFLQSDGVYVIKMLCAVDVEF
jgi:hypothetical protein